MAWRISLLTALLTLFGVQSAAAQPSVPATFYGSVTIDGQPAPTGADIRGLIDGLDCTQSAPGERPAIRDGNATAYVIAVVHDSQRPGCGRPGATVTFTINGEAANQRATWQPGPIEVNLSIGTGAIVPLPTATPTVAAPRPTPTNPPSEPSPLPGTPPTDDITLPGTPFPAPTNGNSGLISGAGAESLGERDSGSALPILVTVVAALAIVGAGAGFALSRRK